MADATDLKSVIRKGVRVRVPPRVPPKNQTKRQYSLVNTAFFVLQGVYYGAHLSFKIHTVVGLLKQP